LLIRRHFRRCRRRRIFADDMPFFIDYAIRASADYAPPPLRHYRCADAAAAAAAP